MHCYIPTCYLVETTQFKTKKSTVQDNINIILHGGLAAFAVYFCMYAFRKPFSAAQFEGLYVWGMHYKIILIISQVIGYAISKFWGIKFISELSHQRRGHYILGFIGIAELMLLMFALVPPPYNLVFMLLNGLPLGLIWGLVFSFLEGRRVTEILAAMLCASFILSSGMVKSVGIYLMHQWHVTEFWMPFCTGLLFLLPLFLAVRALQRIPPPSVEDIRSRTKREPMTQADRKNMFFAFAFGLVNFIVFYMLITAFRDFRDNFAAEIWAHLGYEGDASVFTVSEIAVSVSVLLLLAFFFKIQDNEKAFWWMNVTILLGVLMVGISNYAFTLGWIASPMLWMILIGTGLYLAYVPFNGILFERMVALFQSRGNAGFLIYLADSFGYLGAIMVLLYKEFFQQDMSVYHFFVEGGYWVSFLGLILMGLNMWHFRYRKGSNSYAETCKGH